MPARHDKQIPSPSPSAALRNALLALIGVAMLAGTFNGATANVPGYETLGQVRLGLQSDQVASMKVGGGDLDIVFADGASGLDRAKTLAWIRGSAETVSSYFGRFPVAEVSILVVAQDGGKVGHATTWGYDGSTIRIGVGRDTDAAAFAQDWVMVHEMIHLALPNLPENQLWAQEGSATYAEPIARAQLGKLTPAEIWGSMMRGMPQGLPKAGDKGLDATPTWGRTYWGGAVFYLIADVRIHQQTGNAKGLQDAFRAINRASHGNEADWTMDEIVKIGDEATGTHVLADLYTEMRNAPVSPDLDALFAELGVDMVGDKIVLDDNASLASVRKAITAKSPT